MYRCYIREPSQYNGERPRKTGSFRKALSFFAYYLPVSPLLLCCCSRSIGCCLFLLGLRLQVCLQIELGVFGVRDNCERRGR